MKYGLISHIKTQNIGDDIQCYAMQRFLPHLDYLIDREHLDSFYTETGEKVAALLGGWYIHRPLNWPPSPFLKLLPISFHLSISNKKGLLALTYYGADWFKKFPAIGCRDEGSVEFLKNYGIAAYLTGCFTLTLEPFPDVEHHGKIIAVDVPNEVIEFIKRKTKKDIFITSHNLTQIQFPQEVLKFVEDHDPKVIIPTSHYPAQLDIPHENVLYPGNWSYRHTLVEGLLRFYQGASLVVTSRLHVALPCLALGTPILWILDSKRINAYRFSTYMPYVNHTTPEALLSRNYPFDFNKPEANPVGYEKFPKLIKAAVKTFIASCENDISTPSVDFEIWLDGYQKNLRLKKIIQRLVLKPETETPLDEVNHTTLEALLSRNYSFDFNKPESNPVSYEKFPELIKATAKNLIDSCENDISTPLVDFETWLDGYQKNLRLKKIIQRLVLKPETETPLPENPDIYNYDF